MSIATRLKRIAALRCAVLLTLATAACASERTIDGLAVVSPNDNRARAGAQRGDTLTVSLVATLARWYPEEESGAYVDAPVFAEEGKPPQIPAPLIRATTGTVIVATVRNALGDSTLRVAGLSSREMAELDTLVVLPGESRTVTFTAGTPGTYLYLGQAGTVDWNVREREQLAGALVIDSVGALTDDRIFVMNVWGEPTDSTSYRNAVTINGRSWPHTERITATTGDSVHWRWVNATVRPHPMHLHGFYYNVTARGGAVGDTAFAPAQQRAVVTEVMKPFTTMSIAFQPDRPGNWLFHCHIGFHVLSMARLGESQHDDHTSADAGRHMAGLVLGLTVRPARGWKAPPRESPRAMRLIVQEGERRGRASRALSFVLQSDAAEPAADSVELPGSMLVLTRDEPTDITVVNRLSEPTAVHWHGIELESYSDGVVGFSGEGRRVAPLIAPGDSFTARLTLPRSGTFIYHTHLNDLEQLTSGLYGAIIVIDPASRFDTETDRVFIAGWDGDGEPPRLIVNGDSTPPPLDFVRGAEYRLRFVNIGPAASFRALLTRGGDTATWRPRAKDGADVPNHARTERPSVVIVDVGETADFDFLPARTGDYTLTFAHAPTLPAVVQRIRVR